MRNSQCHIRARGFATRNVWLNVIMALVLAPLLVVGGVVGTASSATAAVVIPTGFTPVRIPTGQPAANLANFEFLPGGQVLTLGRDGLVTVVSDAGRRQLRRPDRHRRLAPIGRCLAGSWPFRNTVGGARGRSRAPPKLQGQRAHRSCDLATQHRGLVGAECHDNSLG